MCSCRSAAALDLLAELALELCALAGEAEEEREALAFALVNRLSGKGGLPDRQLLLALAALCRAASGEAPDPVRGATRFHLHTESPDWACTLPPAALIGGYLFYAARRSGHPSRPSHPERK